jgi:hypothetical protein
MPQPIWDLSGTDDRCDSYGPGHQIHWIHFSRPRFGVSSVVSVDDGPPDSVAFLAACAARGCFSAAAVAARADAVRGVRRVTVDGCRG